MSEYVYHYSDMLENSQVLPWTQFSAQPAQQGFVAVRRSGFVPSLQNTQVEVVGCGPSHTRNHSALTDLQDRTISEFWQLYFNAGGASVSYRTPIEP